MRASTSDNGSDLPRSRSVARPFALADELPVPLDIDQLNFFLRGVQPKRARRDPPWPPLTKGGEIRLSVDGVDWHTETGLTRLEARVYLRTGGEAAHVLASAARRAEARPTRPPLTPFTKVGESSTRVPGFDRMSPRIWPNHKKWQIDPEMNVSGAGGATHQ